MVVSLAFGAELSFGLALAARGLGFVSHWALFFLCALIAFF
jgi:uncharacterized membrane protein YdfJ with MMPL/SSD domain